MLRVISSYHRRITERLNSVPVRLLWFAVRPPDETHVERLKLAKYLLDTPNEFLNITARKVKLLFHDTISYCVANDGKIQMRLYALFRLLARTWTADTQQVEGYMSLIQAAVSRAPSISEPLLDARVGIHSHIR